jgi:plasmid maintenance system antidote protein VapI
MNSDVPVALTFEVVRSRLIQKVRRKIDNGEFTERGFARILGISQSQTHNVLKGTRTMQIELADRILMKLGLTIMDLLIETELESALRRKMVKWDAEIVRDPGSNCLDDLDLDGLPAIKMTPARSYERAQEQSKKVG